MDLKVTAGLPTAKYEKKWQFCVGSCHASTLLRADAIALLKRVHDELGIKRVRCHGLFNDDMGTITSIAQVFKRPVGENIVETNFYKVGLVYDNLLSIGMKPFVELSFMPEILAADKTRSFVYDSIMSLPKDMKKWCDFIEAYLSYLFHRYGEDEVVTWHFEVWNEPDLSGVFFKGSQSGYLEFYEATARTIKAFCPRLQVGGPASSASAWIPEFVGYCKERNVPLDFVSTHQYIGEPFIGVKEKVNEEKNEPENEDAVEQLRNMTMSKAFAAMPEGTSILDCFHKFFGTDGTEKDGLDIDLLPKNAKIVKEQADGLPVFYTEWNLSASFGAYSQDTRKVACYDVRTSLAIEDIVDGNSIWCYSDIFEELHQFKEPFHGGYGMMTYHGIPKPVYHGMKMLAQAEENRISLDTKQFSAVEAAAFEGECEKQVLLYRMSTKWIKAAPEKVKLSIDLSQAPKRVYLQRIDDNHCNPLKVWEEMGRPNDLTKVQVQHIQETSKMIDEELVFIYQNGILTAEVEVGINDIYFIRIAK